MRVMILDDKQIRCKKLESLLVRTEPIEAIWCLNSPAALMDAYRKKRPNTVFIRLGDTAFNGLQVARQLKSLDRHAKILFISETRDYALHAHGMGAAGYLLEPLDMAVLHRAVWETALEI